MPSETINRHAETAKLYLLLRGENPRGLTPEQVAELEACFPRD